MRSGTSAIFPITSFHMARWMFSPRLGSLPRPHCQLAHHSACPPCCGLPHSIAPSDDRFACEPSWLIKPLIESLRWPASWHGYWLTAILAVLNLVFLAAWAGSTYLGFGSRRALTGGWVRASKFFF